MLYSACYWVISVVKLYGALIDDWGHSHQLIRGVNDSCFVYRKILDIKKYIVPSNYTAEKFSALVNKNIKCVHKSGPTICRSLSAYEWKTIFSYTLFKESNFHKALKSNKKEVKRHVWGKNYIELQK